MEKLPANYVFFLDGPLHPIDISMAASSSSSADYLLQEELEKIRPHVTAALPNQKAPALLLVAIEDTLQEQNANLTPVAYFAALVSTLEQQVKKEHEEGTLSLGEADVLPSVLYLLALVVPQVSSAVLRTHTHTALGVLAPLLNPLSNSAPPLRSLLGIYQAWLPHLESSQLHTPLVRQSFATITEYSLDPRPKVRKKAQDVVQAVLASPPAPALIHPYAVDVADYILRQLDDVVGKSGALRAKDKAKAGKANTGMEIGIWSCAFVKTIAPYWPSERIAQLVNSLLRLPALSSSYMTTNAYDLLSLLLSRSASDSSFEEGKIPSILSVMLGSQPDKNDHLLAAAWLRVVEHGMVAYAKDDSDGCAKEVANVWRTVWKWFEQDDSAILISAADALSAIARYCITVPLVEAALNAKGEVPRTKTTLGGIISLAETSLSNISYAQAVPYVMRVITALLSRLRVRTGNSVTRPPTAAEKLMISTIKIVGAMRIKKGFEHRERADAVLGMAIEVIGPEGVLDVLPLNLEPEKLAVDEGRAYLLPLLRSRVTNASLGHFVQYFVLLSERLFNVQAKAEEDGKAVEAKVYGALVEQIWACFPAYCDLPVDLKAAFTPEFAQVLTQVLYQQPSMRSAVLRGLQRLVERNTSLASSSGPQEELKNRFGMDQSDGKANIDFLRGITGNLLSVFFNVFGSAERDARGQIGDVIPTYFKIADIKIIASTYERVINLLKDDMKKHAPVVPASGTSVSYTMLDLLTLFVPHLPLKHANNLLWMVATPEFLANKDASIQKKAYRLLARLAQSGKILHNGEGTDRLLTVLSENSAAIAAGAKRDRLSVFAALVPNIPPTLLHYIAQMLTEAVLGTKEVNEGARNEAFELLVQMGNKMSQGGTISRSLLGEMEDNEDVPASIQEFITMVAAGLAGTTPHMISASITALSRLLFEFRESIPDEMKQELISTIIMFVESKNREIVKSALGFAKVVVTALPSETVRPHLPTVIPALLKWSHDHKNHFKPKVRHIFERLIRKFGFEAVYNEADEEDAKVLTNIKKRKDRAKRKKATAEAGGEEEQSDEDDMHRTRAGNAFEDVLYGSESELEDESDDERPVRNVPGGKKGAKGAARLRMDADEPMDLLHDAAAQLTKSSAKHRKPGQDASNFKTDESGRLVIVEDEEMVDATPTTEDVEGNAYRETLTSADGFTRGRRGEVKFNKNTKKRRAEEDMDGDVEMADADQPPKKKTFEDRKQPTKLGQEFRSKKAKGDVRKAGQPEPYAYVSLAQAGSKKSGVKHFNVRKQKR
ncbi:NUC173-domain-containing protein [Dacryopinax primogenitus]|uniref:NUC173-domain-containing protein n=1 Tax=Dacryopinax primogenitus (strain DJM 731) TaxID=1858805 RepID=M5FNG6_DACPD|nr:NUC173-domain-containing protein [Dacryopinax primogenitus]EJT97410.1 NUC173-domain-containing protein [Dacryopinax primogenitus]